MTYKDVLNIDLESFNNINDPKVFRSYIKTMTDVIKKRLKTAEKYGKKGRSPAIRVLEKSGGLPQYRGITDINTLRHEFTRAKIFLTSETSTFKDWARIRKETISTLKTHGVTLSDDQWEDFWEAYEALKELDSSFESVYGLRYNALQEINNRIINGEEPKDVAIAVNDMKSNLYERQQRERIMREATSKYFKLPSEKEVLDTAKAAGLDRQDVKDVLYTDFREVMKKDINRFKTQFGLNDPDNLDDLTIKNMRKVFDDIIKDMKRGRGK